MDHTELAATECDIVMIVMDYHLGVRGVYISDQRAFRENNSRVRQDLKSVHGRVASELDAP
jgi:hypothetical protein